VTRPGGAAPETPALEPEAAYYQAIEEFFVSRRGDPLFLSNADWLLIRKWRRARVPLRIVLRGIANALDAHQLSWSRRQKVGSLAYCGAEVEAARERWQRALALGEQEGLDVGRVLRGFAEALEGARALGARAGPEARRISEDLRRRSGRPEAAASVESWLVQQEKALVEAVRSDLGSAGVAAVEQAADAGLVSYRDRMPAKVLAQIREESVTRRLLERHALPRLSLFHLAG
jgi:hypothetical protein